MDGYWLVLNYTKSEKIVLKLLAHIFFAFFDNLIFDTILLIFYLYI